MLSLDVSIEVFGSGGSKGLTWGDFGGLNGFCTVRGCKDLMRRIWQEFCQYFD